MHLLVTPVVVIPVVVAAAVVQDARGHPAAHLVALPAGVVVHGGSGDPVVSPCLYRDGDL